MKTTFQSFVFGCRVNEAERIKMDKQLVEAGYTVDLASPSFLIINTCAITAKAEREAKQLIYQLRKQYPEAKIVLTGCSATLWQKYKTDTSFWQAEGASRIKIQLIDILVPNDKKSSLISCLKASEESDGSPLATAAVARPAIDKFRYSNRLLVKIQDGCQRFCSYCIVPYLRGQPQSERINDIIKYINSFSPAPSEVVLSAVNTEAFGLDTKETLVSLIKAVLNRTKVPRLALGSIHPWSLTDEFMDYYKTALSQEQRFIQFFHVPIQSGNQRVLGFMKREYEIQDIMGRLNTIHHIQPNALIATDVIVGFLGETDELFDESYELLKRSPISRFHVFRFSNRPHTAAFYMKKRFNHSLDPDFHRDDTEAVLFEPTSKEKKNRSNRLIKLSNEKYQTFISSQIGKSCEALVIAKASSSFWGALGRAQDRLRLQNQEIDPGQARMTNMKILLDNHVEGIIQLKDSLPGTLVHVTIVSAKDGLVFCKES